MSYPVCRGSVLRYKSKVRLWEKQVSILTLPSLKPPLLGWNLGKTPFGMTGRRPLGRRKVLEGAADAQGWGRAGRAELPCPACPALSVCAPGARNSLRYSTEERRAALHWHLGQESTKDWNNSTTAFGCPTRARSPPESPPRDSVEPGASRGKHIYPDCLNAHLYHMAAIHKG